MASEERGQVEQAADGKAAKWVKRRGQRAVSRLRLVINDRESLRRQFSLVLLVLGFQQLLQSCATQQLQLRVGHFEIGGQSAMRQTGRATENRRE